MSAGIDDLKVLLRYQASAIALSAQHQLLVIEKSRRTGITYGFAADAVLTAAPATRPENVYYIAYNLDMTREFIGYVAHFAKVVAKGTSPRRSIPWHPASRSFCSTMGRRPGSRPCGSISRLVNRSSPSPRGRARCAGCRAR